MSDPQQQTSATPGKASASTPAPAPERTLVRLLGPAFVAAIAYVDPGNVAANLSAGAKYGYLLVWVLVVANVMAVIVQYLSAKLGLVTGKSLAELLGERMPKLGRVLFWVQAQFVAIATDLAEVIGGALALAILFDLPLVLGGIIVGIVSMVLLSLQRHGQRVFERVIVGMLVIITIGFVAGLFVSPLDWGGVAGGLVPRFAGTETVVLAASMLGATVMPHAIYLHSSLTRDRHGVSHTPARLRRLLLASRWDVVLALIVAGGVNIAMLLLAASSLAGVEGTDTIEGAAAAISMHLGPAFGVIFAIGLLASGLASTSVGAYAGADITGGLLPWRIPLLVRRLITLVPALLLLGIGLDPTWALVLSQVVLSFGIPFAIIPLIWLTSRRGVMGEHTNDVWLQSAAVITAGLIVALNVALIWLTFTGQA
ncbi:MAG: Nramp family divalent metal transporter [Leucobacter sp.]|jgi:manganese transport protein|nr:Nramp family divalent metal transporter [Leucobacter sp.]